MEQQNKYRVIVSARAAQMLVSHAAFLAQVSPAAAERLTVEFEKAAKSLEQIPQRCPWLRGEYIPKNAYRFILFEKRYIVRDFWTPTGKKSRCIRPQKLLLMKPD